MLHALLRPVALASGPAPCAPTRRSRLEQLYDVQGELGHGAFGSAFLARRRADGAAVCLKVLDQQRMGATERRMVRAQGRHGDGCRHAAGWWAAVQWMRLSGGSCGGFLPLQTRSEVQVLRSLTHPNIVQYHDAFSEGGKQYM